MATLTVSQINAFEARSVQLFVDAASGLGVPGSIAMIYGLLFGSATPISFSEIEQKLELSKGLRDLRDMGAVQPATTGGDSSEHRTPSSENSIPASNTVCYAPVVELRILLSRILSDRGQPHLESSQRAITEMESLLPPEEAESEVLAVRLRHLGALQKRSRRYTAPHQNLSPLAS